MSKVIIIAGPTAVGKTALGVKLAKTVNGEVVSADSMQIYSALPICSAMPDKAEMQGVPHHLIGFLAATAEYSVNDYQRDALSVISDISSRKKVPIVVGGTGLYIHSLLYKPGFAVHSDPVVRAELEQQSGEELFERLRKIDPASATKLHPNDVRRVRRALEVFLLSGTPISLQNTWEKPNTDIDFKLFCIGMDRQRLYERINKRVDVMVQNGLVDEVRALLNIPHGEQCMKAIGCRQLLPYFDGKITLEQAIEDIKQESRRYAKRQLTWMRRENAVWLDAENDDMLQTILEEIGNE